MVSGRSGRSVMTLVGSWCRLIAWVGRYAVAVAWSVPVFIDPEAGPARLRPIWRVQATVGFLVNVDDVPVESWPWIVVDRVPAGHPTTFSRSPEALLLVLLRVNEGNCKS
jgi:hypothetical protein